MNKKNYVVALTGTAGSGKTTVAKEIIKLLNATLLLYDDYEKLVNWPKDMHKWVIEGMNLEQLKAKQMLQDIQALRMGKSINHPISGESIHPSPIIIVEDPSGRECKDYAPLYDFVVFINTPLEICLARAINRRIDDRTSKVNKNLAALTKEELVKLIEEVKKYTSFQYWHRDVYTAVSEKVKPNVDLVIDGDQPTEELVRIIVKEIRNRMER